MAAETFRVADGIHGRLRLPSGRTLTTEYRARELKSNRKNLVHRSKNGVYDPLTFYHVLDTLLDLLPDSPFRTIDLLPVLKARHSMLIWDATTVGRVVSDIATSLEVANGAPAIQTFRKWNGMTYATPGEVEGRKAMENLLDDLAVLCEAEMNDEAEGIFPKRTASPMASCPSVTMGAKVASSL